MLVTQDQKIKGVLVTLEYPVYQLLVCVFYFFGQKPGSN